MSAAGSGLVGPWGDRTYLLPKAMGYVLSLYARATVSGSYLTVAPQAEALRHLLGDKEVTMPEGLRCDLPVGDLVGGSGEIGSPIDPTSGALRLQLQIDLNRSEKLLMDCRGVINFEGVALDCFVPHFQIFSNDHLSEGRSRSSCQTLTTSTTLPA